MSNVVLCQEAAFARKKSFSCALEAVLEIRVFLLLCFGLSASERHRCFFSRQDVLNPTGQYGTGLGIRDAHECWRLRELGVRQTALGFNRQNWLQTLGRFRPILRKS
jgi:hypothetical protein